VKWSGALGILIVCGLDAPLKGTRRAILVRTGKSAPRNDIPFWGPEKRRRTLVHHPPNCSGRPGLMPANTWRQVLVAGPRAGWLWQDTPGIVLRPTGGTVGLQFAVSAGPSRRWIPEEPTAETGSRPRSTAQPVHLPLWLALTVLI